jgi:hypothetical protein
MGFTEAWNKIFTEIRMKEQRECEITYILSYPDEYEYTEEELNGLKTERIELINKIRKECEFLMLSS